MNNLRKALVLIYFFDLIFFQRIFPAAFTFALIILYCTAGTVVWLVLTAYFPAGINNALNTIQFYNLGLYHNSHFMLMVF